MNCQKERQEPFGNTSQLGIFKVTIIMKRKKLLPIVKYDDYIKEWDYEKNKDHNPNTLTAGSSYKVWWKCSVCGHSWQAAPSRRRLQGFKCPICSVKNVNAERIKKKGSFADHFPEKAKDWDYDKNGELLPTQVTAGSNIRVYWKCHICGREWNCMIISHAKSVYSCKKCANRERPLKRFGNQPLVETHPQLADEWDYKKNGELTPYNVTAHFHKRVNWVCHKGHHWAAFVSTRARLNIGCPHCKKEWGTSFPEQAIYFYLRKVTKAQNRYIFKGQEIDIFLGDKEWNTAIEYDGVYYHSTLKSQNRENKKNQLLADNGIRLIRIKEGDYDKVSNGIIYVKYQDNHTYLKWVINEILKLCDKEEYIDQLDIDIERDRNQIYALYIQSEKENSIVAQSPEVAKQWDYEKNGDIKPEYIPYTSHKKFYWKCEKGHSWKAQVNTRFMGHGCPCCAGVILVPGENDLLSQNPELVKEWDYERNGELTPDRITVNNHKRVWWVCKTCGHHWAVGVAHRNKGEGCPKCADKQRTLSKHKRIIALKGSFADNYPHLLKEWDYDRNRGLDPKMLPPHCGKKVWWICSTCGYSWQTTMAERANGRGCTKCADKQRTLSRRKRIVELKGSFADTHPHLIKDWDYSKNEGTPNDYSAGSHYRVNWKCHHCGYEWEAPIFKRTGGHKCPKCHK